MARGYSKQRGDGTVAYYDSEEAMLADVPPAPGMFEFSVFWAVIGFFISVLAVALVNYAVEPGAAWSKPIRFSLSLLGVAAGTYVIGRAGQFLLHACWLLMGILIVLGILGTVVATLWHFA